MKWGGAQNKLLRAYTSELNEEDSQKCVNYYHPSKNKKRKILEETKAVTSNPARRRIQLNSHTQNKPKPKTNDFPGIKKLSKKGGIA